MTKSAHLEKSQIVRYLDGELSGHQLEQFGRHLDCCVECRDECESLASLSVRIRDLVSAPQLDSGGKWRDDLVRRLASQRELAGPRESAGRVLQRFAWGMALAAALALGILVAPRRATVTATEPEPSSSPKLAQASLNINGESFIALPYSNPDLPLNTPRIVEMRIPVASLTDAGVELGPMTNESSDGFVRANVLLGMDGQPLGLHLLNAE